MAYESVDRLQNVLAKKIFNYTQDKKKAAGRALGTLVEIVTFYLLKSWGFEHSVGIETALAEYGRPDITHNVEYSLHPILREHRCSLPKKLPITTMRIFAGVDENRFSLAGFEKSNATLLTSTWILRNSCVLSSCEKSRLVATLAGTSGDVFGIMLLEQSSKPYAIFECKRVESRKECGKDRRPSRRRSRSLRSKVCVLTSKDSHSIWRASRANL